MALLRTFERKIISRPSLHREIGAKYSVFEKDGCVLLQIDTYGTEDREKPEKLSQTIQLDEIGAKALFEIIGREFSLK